MNYLESFVWVRSGEFPYIRFGTGKKKLVMLAGMSMTGLVGLGAPVSAMYRDYADTRFAMKLRTFGSGCLTFCTKLEKPLITAE